MLLPLFALLASSPARSDDQLLGANVAAAYQKFNLHQTVDEKSLDDNIAKILRNLPPFLDDHGQAERIAKADPNLPNSELKNSNLPQRLKDLGAGNFIAQRDTMMFPNEILARVRGRGTGGGCHSFALAFAALLRKSGLSDDDIRIVDTVRTDDIRRICPSPGKPYIQFPWPKSQVEAERMTRDGTLPPGLSGHSFVLIRRGKKWRIYSSDSSDSADFMAPEILAGHLTSGSKPIKVPQSSYRSFLAYEEAAKLFAEGVIPFHSQKLSEFSPFTFNDRYSLVASGSSNSKICRWGSASFPKAVSSASDDYFDVGREQPAK